MAQSKFISLEDEEKVVVKEPEYGTWVPIKAFHGENYRVSKGITVSVSPKGGSNFEINLVGERTEIIAGDFNEAKTVAKNMLRDKLLAALELSR